jgi:hypothetical protein
MDDAGSQTEQGGARLRRTLWESWGSPFKTAAFNHSATTPGEPNFLPDIHLCKRGRALSRRSGLAGDRTSR